MVRTSTRFLARQKAHGYLRSAWSKSIPYRRPRYSPYVCILYHSCLPRASFRSRSCRSGEKKDGHAEGAIFVPFIIETFGGFGKDARAFITDLAKFASATSQVWSAAETRFMVRAEVQRALFEGNLRVANAVLQESNPIRYAWSLSCSCPTPTQKPATI